MLRAPRCAPGGRVAFQPTDAQRAEVRELAGMGTNQQGIARRIGIGMTTLAKYFREELARGVEEANLEVAQSAFNQATGRKWVTDPETCKDRLVGCDPSPTMTIFWCKLRMGWREPLIVHERVDNPLASASDEELEARLEELRRATRGPGPVVR